jgi:hypothetical protein
VKNALAFVAGFSERLVPGFVSRVETSLRKRGDSVQTPEELKASKHNSVRLKADTSVSNREP